MKRSKIFDTIVLGAGPAGLSAAIYLGRSLRSALVIDKGFGRWSGHQTNDNYLGFPKGVRATKLKELGEKQAKRFGAHFESDEVISAKKTKKGFSLQGRKGAYRGRSLILATGVKDFYPSFPFLQTYIGRSLFWCILCDGYRVRNKKIAVVGNDDAAAKSCLSLLKFTKKITLITNAKKEDTSLSKAGVKKLEKFKVPIVPGSIEKIDGSKGMMKAITLDSGRNIKVDYMFNKQAGIANSEMAASLNVLLETGGYIKTDISQRTNQPLIYAAGDVTSEMSHQIISAAHEGATAAQSADEDLTPKNLRSI